MKFSTVVPIVKLPKQLTYGDKILSLGSCFAVNIGKKFKQFQFQNVVNPFGILFHPKAIEQIVEYAYSGYEFSEKDVFCHNEIWSCFAVHSDMNELEEEDIITKLNIKLFDLQAALKESSLLILTFGTAWVYEYCQTGEIVANCHKVPQSEFVKRLLNYDEIVESYLRIIYLVKELNPNIQIMFTLSPVRHIKDGIVENQRSKALLHAAMQDVLEQLKGTELFYFPSYEIMMDELRDYRFYKADMLHPNEIAIDYIWEKFVENCIAEDSISVMKKVDEVQKGLNHRPFNPTATQHLNFLDTLIEKIDFLLEKYPFMSFR